MSFRVVVVLVGFAAGCAGQVQAPPPAKCAAVAEQKTDLVLASIDGIPIRRADIAAERQAEMKQAENETRQQALTALFLGVDDVVNDTLMKREAERRSLSVDKLYELEVATKVAEPTDAEVAGVYEANKEQIPVPLEQAAPYIKRQMGMQRAGEVLQAFVEQLKSKADVRYAIPVPELPRFEIKGTDGPEVGPKDAAVAVVLFSDFECPYCSRASKLMDQLKALYPDKLRLQFRDFPLSQHAKARGAAQAAHCAFEQGKFWPYHDLLFASAPAISADDLKKHAVTVGLDLKAFETCLESDRPEAAIKVDEREARRLGLDGTPGIFLNGIRLMGVLPLPLMQALIDKELGK
ncbi:MAG: thioredoxin domain-containing protein [Deltaproteobacteria bacterium]|nr:thioredoxin domain-containing protein [Deltaproteobacteria bacterium]